MKKLFIFGFIAIIAASGCKPKLSGEKPKPGTAIFTNYLAVGNSLTAGYADNSLYRTGQLNSYPQRLSEQFALVGGGSFKQPLLPVTAAYPTPQFVLGLTTNCAGVTGLGPIPSSDTAGGAQNAINIAAQGPFNNVGVPGIRCIDYLIPGYGALNPYAARFFASPSTQTPMDEALLLPNVTFFTVWLGANDVLGYATAGGTGSDMAASWSLPTNNDISNYTLFQVTYDSVVSAMVSHGAKGALINIPDVTAVPFFTTIPHNALVLTRQGQADSLNAAYAPLGIHFAVGPNNFIIQDATAPGGIRQMKNDELVLLSTPQDSLTCAGWGSIKPLANKYVLTENEIAYARAAITDFNNVIAADAHKYGLALVDMHSYMSTLQSGIIFNGVTYGPQYIQGGTFSLDGVHLNPRGYALVANQIIAAINSTYGSTIPTVDANKYVGIKFP